MRIEPVLSIEQVRAAENALIAAGTSVEALMDIAGKGAAEWIWRMAARARVTVLCGPGNNGGDGYVIAETLRTRGCEVVVVAPYDPATSACANARGLYGGEIASPDRPCEGEVFVDCLFGSGLRRPLRREDGALLSRLAQRHRSAVAIDVPSGVQSDSGMLLCNDLHRYDLTVALGAWKRAHLLMPAASIMGRIQLVPIGLSRAEGAATLIGRPRIDAPAPDAHKYVRGLLGVVGGAMPGASVLAATAAQGAGAGYVKLFAQEPIAVASDLVADAGPLASALDDDRIGAILVGPGLGRDAAARERLAAALAASKPMVIDADALILLSQDGLAQGRAPVIATPHEGELAALERAFSCEGSGAKPERAAALARASGMIVVAKGPDTVVAAPDGRLAFARRATSWLSTAGTGDVLAGTIASRLATGRDAFEAACEGVWLHGEAARLSPPAFTADMLARHIPTALAACL